MNYDETVSVVKRTLEENIMLPPGHRATVGRDIIRVGFQTTALEGTRDTGKPTEVCSVYPMPREIRDPAHAVMETVYGVAAALVTTHAHELMERLLFRPTDNENWAAPFNPHRKQGAFFNRTYGGDRALRFYFDADVPMFPWLI